MFQYVPACTATTIFISVIFFIYQGPHYTLNSSNLTDTNVSLGGVAKRGGSDRGGRGGGFVARGGFAPRGRGGPPSRGIFSYCFIICVLFLFFMYIISFDGHPCCPYHPPTSIYCDR